MIEQFIINGITIGSIYALTAIGFVIIYKSVIFFNFAHGVVYAIGAYCAYSLTISLGINPVSAFFLPSY